VKPDQPPKIIFFDAVGTLFHLAKGVGYHYALVGERLGLSMEATVLERAFGMVWNEMPMRPSTGIPREEDDKGWWRALVHRVIDRVSPTMQDLDRDAFFEVAYAHFAKAGVWEMYPEVFATLEALSSRFSLGVISNFDGRLRLVLDQLGIAKLLSPIVISSEVGADKPDAIIYERALQLAGFAPNEALFAGDDPVRDWQGAASAGLTVFELNRPSNSLRDLLRML